MTSFEHIIVVPLLLDRLSVRYTCLCILRCDALETMYSLVLYVYPQKQKDVLETVCRIPMITSAKEEQRMIATCRKVSYFI